MFGLASEQLLPLAGPPAGTWYEHLAGLAVLGYTSQARFLFNCGLLPWLEAADLPAPIRLVLRRVIKAPDFLRLDIADEVDEPAPHS